MNKNIIFLIAVLLAGFIGYRLHPSPKTVMVNSNYNKQCWDLAESLNRHAQGIYVEYSGYIFSGWADDQGAIDTLNGDIAGYNTEVAAYNGVCHEQALKAPVVQ